MTHWVSQFIENWRFGFVGWVGRHPKVSVINDLGDSNICFCYKKPLWLKYLLLIWSSDTELPLLHIYDIKDQSALQILIVTSKYQCGNVIIVTSILCIWAESEGVTLFLGYWPLCGCRWKTDAMLLCHCSPSEAIFHSTIKVRTDATLWQHGMCSVPLPVWVVTAVSRLTLFYPLMSC